MTQKHAIWTVILLSFIVLASLYSDVLFHPNDFLFSIKGDGLKNYFNYVYHIKHDPGYFSFEGMNYPYGETIFMVDCHPFYSNLLKFISQNIFDVSPYAIGILNATMLGSLVICSLFVFLIFDYYKFAWYLSIPGAIAIAFLSSNVLLWEVGHYALSYVCFFPISWYLILKYNASDDKIKYSILILINTLFWYYTHVYLGIIILGFTFSFHFFSFLLNKKNVDVKRALSFTIQVILPAIIVYSIITIADNHVGRINMPYIHDHKASVYNVFFPNHSYLRPLYEFFFDLSPQENQTWSKIGNYIGLSTNLILIFIILLTLFSLLVRKKWILKGVLSKFDVVIILSSIALLLFSFAFPFKYNLDYLLPSILKQLVGLGRFAWPFYFIIIIYSLLLIRKLFNNKTSGIIILAAIVLLFSEGLSYHLALRKTISKYPNIFIKDSMSGINSNGFKTLNFKDYQAIIPIPFYHGYLSLHSYESTFDIKELSMKLSYTSGVPLMSALLSRPSVLESKNILQLFSPPFYNKPIKGKLNDKPILMVLSKQEHSLLEKKLLNKAKKVFDSERFELYELPVDSLFMGDNEKYIHEFISQKDSFNLDIESGYFFKDSSTIYYDSFENFENEKAYRGKGSLSKEKKSLNVIYKSKPGEYEQNVEYNLSFWYYNHLYDQTFNSIWIALKDSTDKTFYYKNFNPAKSNIYDGNWALNEITFKFQHKGDYLVLVSKGADLYSDSIYIDELLIRPNNQNLFKPVNSNTSLQSIIIRNNETIKY